MRNIADLQENKGPGLTRGCLAELEAEARSKHIARCPGNQVLREPARRNSISDPAPYLAFEDAGRTCEI